MQQLLQVAADDTLVLVQGPAALLGIILPPSQVCKDHLQPLLVMADLPRGQGGAQVLALYQREEDLLHDRRAGRHRGLDVTHHDANGHTA